MSKLKKSRRATRLRSSQPNKRDSAASRGFAERYLQMETLEDRRMLATVTVTNGLDVVNGDTMSLAMLVSNDGGDGISLREALEASNNTLGEDVILFDSSLSGQSITLSGTQLQIEDELTINAATLDENVTIDADQLSRIFEINAPGTTTEDFDVTLAGLTLTGGKTTEELQRGGAILSLSAGTLFFEQSTVRGNRTEGPKSGGGGIRVGGNIMLTDSTVSGNSTLGDFSRGGGIDALGTVTVLQSTISGNTTQGLSADSGGIRATGDVTVTQSTITDNHVMAANASGGGIWNDNDTVLISNSILFGNTAPNGGGNLRSGSGTLTVNHSLFGDTSDMAAGELVSINAGIGNLLDMDPLLDVLADNGGPTETHALMPGSPAIDTGDPSIAVNPNEFDQRGNPFVRVANGRIDMGAFESEAPSFSADFDDDTDIDGADFLAWQRGFGIVGTASPSDGDANEDSNVDGIDLGIWQEQFGTVIVNIQSPSEPTTGRLVDLAIAQMTRTRTAIVDGSEEVLLDEFVDSNSISEPNALAPVAVAAVTSDDMQHATAQADTEDHVFSEEVLGEIFKGSFA